MSYGEIASALGKSEQHVIDSMLSSSNPVLYEEVDRLVAVCTGASTPTTDEFNALARVLGITQAVCLSPPDITPLFYTLASFPMTVRS